LLTAKTLVVVFEVKPVHGLAVAGVDVIEDTEIDTDAVARVQRIHIGFLGQVGIVGFEAEGDEPLSCSFFLERDFFDGGVIGKWAVIAGPLSTPGGRTPSIIKYAPCSSTPRSRNVIRAPVDRSSTVLGYPTDSV
jgi:hypothetical protein